MLGEEAQAADGARAVGCQPGINAGLVEGVLAGQLAQHLSCLVLGQADDARVLCCLARTARSTAIVSMPYVNWWLR
jgi:hypothetical protein